MKNLLLFVLFSFSVAAQPGAITFNLPLTYVSPSIYSTFAVRDIPSDILITRFTFHVPTPTQSSADACLIADRIVPPTFPTVSASYHQLVCFHAIRPAASTPTPWDIDLDLSSTPLYIPGGSRIGVGSVMASLTGTSSDSYPATFTATTTPYEAGMPRYRSLEIPYIDQVNLPGGLTPVESVYQSNAQFPLDVESAALFATFSTTNANGKHNTACLQWKHQLSIVTSACFDAQTPGPGPWNTPQDLALGWRLLTGDTVELAASGDSTDTQAYLFVRIPDSLTVGPLNVFGNYGNIPSSNLSSYCKRELSRFTHPYFKTPDGVARCLALYAPVQ